MAKKVTNNEPFESSRDGFRQLTVVANGGTATLQAEAGDAWVDVPDGVVSADGMITFHAVSGQSFRVALAGGAEAWISG